MEKLLPQNIEAEQSVLGSIEIDPEAIIEPAVYLKPEHFYRSAHQVIYRAALDLYNAMEPADLITLTDELARRGKLEEVGGASYVTSLANAVPTSGNVDYYGRIVERCAILRALIHGAGQIAAIAYNEPDADVALEQAEGIIFNIGQGRVSRRGPVTLREGIAQFSRQQDLLEDMRQRGVSVGITTGYPELNKKLAGGLKPGDLIILAARPSLGKSALAFNIAANAARGGFNTLIFSLEMSQEQVVTRLVALDALVDQTELATGDLSDDDQLAATEAAGRLSELPIQIDDTPGLTLAQLRSIARRAALAKPLDLIVVDYLQLMEAGALGGRQDPGDGRGLPGGGRRMENRQQEVAAISRGLKAIARELGVPILALSQLSRALEARQDKKPMLSDLRESGGLEQDADVVLFLHRDEVYNPETERPNIADLIIAKHRNGPLGTVSLFFKKKSGNFKQLDLTREPPAWAEADAARRQQREDDLAAAYGLNTMPDGPGDSSPRGERNDDRF